MHSQWRINLLTSMALHTCYWLIATDWAFVRLTTSAIIHIYFCRVQTLNLQNFVGNKGRKHSIGKMLIIKERNQFCCNLFGYQRLLKGNAHANWDIYHEHVISSPHFHLLERISKIYGWSWCRWDWKIEIVVVGNRMVSTSEFRMKTRFA